MRSTFILPTLIGIGAAVPRNNVVDSEPATIEKREYNLCRWTDGWLTCRDLGAPQAKGFSSNPDTVDAFNANNALAKAANGATTPKGYTQSFKNLQGATSVSNYLGWSELGSYDPSACSAKCDQTNTCIAFNIYFERDPSLSTDPFCCPNPPSVIRVKCSLWGTMASDTTANNKGQARDKFQVAIAGSNGYNKQMVFPGASNSPSATSAGSSVKSSGSVSASSMQSSGSVSASSAASKPSTGASVTAAAGGSNSPMNTASSATGTAAVKGNLAVSSSNPSITASPASTSATASGNLAVSSQSASAASSKAVVPVDPGSPATASIASSASSCATPVATPELSFNVNRTTQGTETIWMYGNNAQLGNWNPDSAVALSQSKVAGSTNWFVYLNMTAGNSFEYKYFQRNADWSITWPPMANRQYTVPTGCQTEIVVNDDWPAS
ncbi:hypothetical protein ACLMJK_001468 [Lecanora helva]